MGKRKRKTGSSGGDPSEEGSETAPGGSRNSEDSGDEEAPGAGDPTAGDESAEEPVQDEEPALEKPPAEKPSAEEPAAGKEAEEPAAQEEGDEPAAREGPGEPPEDEPIASNGPHRIRGGILLGLGTLAAFLLMANESQVPHGPLWGALAMLVAAGGLLDLLGLLTLDVPDATPLARTAFGRREGEPVWSAPHFTVPVALLLFVGGVVLGGWEGLPFAILASLAALLPSALFRPGLLVFVVVSAMYLPWLGTYGLWDPWETHYGEVAREILARDDWISLWWAQENWFWSKPILIFWTEALSMGGLGFDTMPDANPVHIEWAVRLPVFLMSLVAVMAVYVAIARIFTRRAGVLSALVLATMPHFFLLAHQAITDIPLVANLTTAVALLLLALHEDPERRVRFYRLGPLTFSARHAVIAVLFLVVAPQALYLISRNVTMIEWSGFAWHGDQFMFGSAGNHGVPGNANAYDAQPYMASLWSQPVAQGIFWALGLGLLLLYAFRERRAQGLTMLGFYLFCALGFMGKGIPGFALPGMVALLFLIASGRWSVLLSGQLRIGIGALTVMVVGFPWYVAMYMRHGPPFTDRLLIHDHINRLAAGVHGDTGGLEYFLEQLGPAMFPWVALVPAALALWLWQGRGPRGGDVEAARQRMQRDTLVLVAVWFVSAFTLFSAMITKFHHYIFPVVPAAAILVGLLLDRLFGKTRLAEGHRGLIVEGLAVFAPVPIVLGVAGLWGDVRGVVPVEVEAAARTEWVATHPWNGAICGALILLGLAIAAGAFQLGRWWRAESDASERRYLAPLAVLLAAGTVVLAFVGRDLSWVTDARPQGNERLIQLFIYNYGRPWPEHFDYRPMLTGFALVATVIVALAVVHRLRPLAARGLLGLALLFTTWTLDIYIVDLSPHWGQRELIRAYYEERGGPDDPLVAWQMNWKGENFYSGNRVAVFVDLDNQKIRQWIGEHRGQRTFVLMEHTRLNSFRGLVGGHEIREVTDKRLCNKFLLIEVTL